MIGLSAPIAGYKGQVAGKRRQRASQGIRDKDVGGKSANLRELDANTGS